MIRHGTKLVSGKPTMARSRRRWVALCAASLLMAVVVPTGAHGEETLRRLGGFETFNSMGFSPDGMTYQSRMAHLLIASATADVPNETGVFETTLDGDLVRRISFPSGIDGALGYSITIATSGPRTGHISLAAFEGGGPDPQTVAVVEFDASRALVGTFEVTGPGAPGDGITWNHRAQTLAVADLVADPPVLIEVTPEGELVRIVETPCMAGVSYNIPTGTYLGVCPDGTMWEIRDDGTALRSFDLHSYGVSQPVGIGTGQGKIFIADEIDVPNSGGIIHVFKSPRPGR